MKKRLPLFLLLLLAAGLLGAQTSQQDSVRTYPPMVSYGQLLGAIPPVRDLQPLPPDPAEAHPDKVWHKANYFENNALNNPNPQPQGGDPLVGQAAERGLSAGPQLNTLVSREGMRSDITPADPNGDIGKNHYVQMINAPGGALFQVFDKQGNSVYGPAATQTIWSQVSSGSFNDPIIQYDPGAERWVMMELKGGIGTNELLIAVSDTDDPTGSWKAYVFQTLGFPDYPKLYVWPDAYYITVNELYNGNKCSGYALEREALLAGDDEFKIYRFELPNYAGVTFQPGTGADWEGGPPPPPGSPGYVFRMYDDAWNGGLDQLQVWEIHVDWQNVDESYSEGPQILYPAPFESTVCFGFNDCLEQPSANAPRLAALENIIMHRAPYRNFGDHESVVFNHVADVSGQTGLGGDAQVRWYELRKTNNNWQIHQQGTYAPDLATNRFMGTISLDMQGNIGLGYSVVSNQVFPGLRLTGRRAADPANLMAIEEFSLKPGQTSHTLANRWGDYSSMTVDPEDGLTFWFTGEYQPSNASWGTWIAAFRIGRDTFDVTPEILVAPQSSALLGDAESVSVSILNGGIEPAFGVNVTLRFENGTVVTDLVADTIFPGQSLVHTFSQTVPMGQVGKNYAFEIITQWASDAFSPNDTLRASVRKLTSNDAAVVGKTNLPGLVCGTEQTVGIILRNASGIPMQSAEIHWRLNNQAAQIYLWTGNLAPGAQDTIYVNLTGILNGLNGLRAIAKLPNGQPDQFVFNDTLTVKFFGNLDGTYLTLDGQTTFGILHWELRNQANQVLITDDLPPGQSTVQICSDDNTCYKFIYNSTTLAWQGNLKFLDIYNNVLFEIGSAETGKDTIVFCTPERQLNDVGALSLLSPVSSPNLSAAEPVTMQLRNFGLEPQSALELSYRLNGQPWITEQYPNTLAPGATATYTFATLADVSNPDLSYLVELKATVSGDQNTANDTVSATVERRWNRDLAVTGLRITEGCSDTGQVFAAVQLTNEGIAEVTGFHLNITTNGVPQVSLPVDLVLPPGITEEYYIQVYGSAFGNNVLAVDVTNVNQAGEDDDIKNDTASIGYSLNEDAAAYALNLLTDQKPEETRWELRDDQGTVLFSGGPYTDQPVTFIYDPWCLELNQCYEFVLFDTGGDGMEGAVSITSEFGSILWILNDPFFGAETSYLFCFNIPTEQPVTQLRTLKVSPNPTTALIEVSLEAGENDREAFCEVFDANGRRLQTARMAIWDEQLKGVISLEPYPPGHYFLKVNGLNQVYTARVVKTAR
ncbi:MAG: T9SS type A sorting domain-containing protein [Saprospiraceae bacterium]|nr:T9SS type A sorting domain-containing protein [Saprospiraceae bacterium]